MNNDGKVSEEEWTKHHDAMSEYLDANKDEIGKSEVAKKKTEKNK